MLRRAHANTNFIAVALEYVDPAVSYPSGWRTPDGSIKPIRVPIQETWQAMEELVDQGLVKNIGISNFQGALILDLLRYCRIRPATLQIEHHPYLVQPDLIHLAKSEGIAITGYSSFGPASFLELDWKKAFDTPALFENLTIITIAQKYSKTPAQVLLRWSTQRGLGVIPKSNSPDRLLENLDVTSFYLEESEIQAISGMDKNLRFNNPIDVSYNGLSLYPVSGINAYYYYFVFPVLRNTSHLCLKGGGRKGGISYYHYFSYSFLSQTHRRSPVGLRVSFDRAREINFC